MPSFSHPPSRSIITTSPKVMYTALTHTGGLHHISWNRQWLLRLYLPPRWQHYFIFRNPYDRLVSFWINKLAREIAAVPGPNGWQDCQRIFFAHLGITPDMPVHRITAALTGLSFDDFMRLLPHVYHKDAHLRPQLSSIQHRFRGVRIQMRVSHLVRMEEASKVLQQSLGIEAPRLNISDRKPHGEYFTPETYAIANEVYAQDFKAFGTSAPPR